MRHTKFAQDGDANRLAKALADLRAGVAAATIRNVTFVAAKQDLATVMDRERRALADLMPERPAETDPVSRAYWTARFDLFPLEARHCSVVEKRISRLSRAPHGEAPRVKAVMAIAREFAERWLDANALVEEAKPFVVKGRIAGVRRTPVRTIKNTGSCPVCAQNVKLSHRRIVDHGFQVVWNARRGRCFGVGYPPFELSAEGALAYAEELKAEIGRTHDAIRQIAAGEVKRFVTKRRNERGRMVLVEIGPDDVDFERIRDLRVIEKESALRQIQHARSLTEAKARDWRPRPLPGEAPSGEEA